MKSVDVTAGTIEYREEGDPGGPPVVLLHGLLMNDAQWNLTLPLLPSGFRYLLPVLPMGGHRIPMREDADLTLPGMVEHRRRLPRRAGPDRRDAGRHATGAARCSSPTSAATNALRGW